MSNTPVIRDPSITPESPWLGLRSFTEEARSFFFGRSDELDDLYERVLDKPLAILFGQSGLGKTSLLQAALVPRLRTAGFLPVLIRLDHDTNAPSLESQLLGNLQVALESAGYQQQAANLSIALTHGMAALDYSAFLWLLLHDPEQGLIPHRGMPADEFPRAVFLIDQFEEIFTLGERPARHSDSAAFRETLAALIENRPPPSLRTKLEEDEGLAERLDYKARHARVLLALREDFLHLLERWRRTMPSLMENRLELRMLGGPQAFRAVVRPGQLRPGMPAIIPDPVGQAIVRFVAGAGDDIPLDEIDAVPPLLSLVCAELNAQRLDTEQAQITQAQFEGHSTDILASFYLRSFELATYGSVLDGVPDAARALKNLRQLIEDRLLSPDGFRESIALDTIARDLSRAADPDASRAVLDALVERRLLTVEERGGVRRIELAHDVLTRIVKISRDERHEIEALEKARLEQERALAETARVLKERNRLRRLAIVASCLALIAVASAIVGWIGFKRSEEAKAQAFEARSQAEESAKIAQARESEAVAAREDAERQRREVATSNAGLKDALRQARENAYIAHFSLAQREWDKSNVAHARELLENPDESEFRGLEWYYLRRRFYPERLTLKGHSSFVKCVAFSPDGKRIASGSVDKTVKLWDAASGRELLTLKGHSDFVMAVVFSPDGKRLASAGGHEVKLWEAATGKELITLKTNIPAVEGMSFSADGSRLALAGDDRTVRLWDAGLGKELLTLRGHAEAVYGVSFSPDGRRVASASWDETIKLWDADTGRELLTLNGHSGGVNGVSFSPDGKRLASASGDGTVKLWDAATGQEVVTMRGHTGSVAGVSYSPKGELIASGGDRTVKLWDAATGQELLTLKGHTGGVFSVSFSPDDKHLASAGDQTVKLWDLASNREVLALLEDHRLLTGVAFSPDGKRLALVASSAMVKLRDAATGEELLTLKGHTSRVNGVAFSPDGKRIASASDDRTGTVKLWDAATGKELLTLTGHGNAVLGVSFSPDGTLVASASWDQTVKLWDVATGQELRTLKGHTDSVHGVSFSPDGRRVASASWDQTVKLWDVATGQELRTLKAQENYRWIRPGSAITAEGVDPLTGDPGTVLALSFSPDGKRLASTGGDDTVNLWDTATGRELLTFKGHAGHVYGVSFNPDGRRLASASGDGTVKLWDVATGQELLTLKGHTGTVRSVAFSPDGKCLASASEDGSVRIWLGEERGDGVTGDRPGSPATP